ncbi:MAG: hypothetical protein Q4Q31_08350 [Bacillota bacterium]|nr:hypothetical protein [Bacillota bacterium]
MKNLLIKICTFMILITLFTGCHQQNKLYLFETKKIDNQVILILKNTSKKPIDLSLKDQKIKCLPADKQGVFIFNKKEFKDTYYDEIEAKESTQYQEYNDFDINRITDHSLQQLNECIKKTKNDKKICYGEVIVFFYQNKSLVDIQKNNFVLKGKEKVITFESLKVWDDTKIIENIYAKK